MTHDPNCIFCKIVAGQIPCFKLHEDEATLAFLDINPVNPGHSLIIPRSHAPNLMASDDADLAAVMKTVRRVASYPGTDVIVGPIRPLASPVGAAWEVILRTWHGPQSGTEIPEADTSFVHWRAKQYA